MNLDVINLKGEKVSDLKAEEAVFGIKPNNGVVRQAVLSEMTNLRQGTHSSKNRARVKGGGRKPWKQKGRGVARAGTIRSPLWRGGGTVFGPEPHSYKHKLSKKLSRLARCSALSGKVLDGGLMVIDDFELNNHKTSNLVNILKTLGVENKKITLLVSSNDNENLDMASRNLNNLCLVRASSASTYDLIDCEILIADKESVSALTKVLM
tara:strand:- start:490 stop:1116 length:627 start_codon:yes stop_codon:yes gene_type:complete